MHLAMRPTPCTTGQVHLLDIYTIATVIEILLLYFRFHETC